MSGSRSLTPDENARVVAAIKKMLVEETQSELAPRLGLKQPSLSAIVNGRNQIGYATARKVAELMGVHADVRERQ